MAATVGPLYFMFLAPRTPPPLTILDPMLNSQVMVSTRDDLTSTVQAVRDDWAGQQV